MSLIRRWGVPAFLLCLSALALPSGAAWAAPDNPPAPDAKSTDALVRDALKSVINEGADMYNGVGKYTEHDYLGCQHLYEGALIAVRPLLSSHPELQKTIDDGLENARNTPRAEMRAFVLRDVIDKVRDGLKPGGPTVPPTKTLWERLGGEAGVSGVVDAFVANVADDPKVNFTRNGKYKLDADGVKHLKKELVDFISSATGGPFEYKGKSMKEVHKGMAITDAEFDAAKVDLKNALERLGVLDADAKAVLGAVETTRKDIVEAAPPPVPEKTTTGKVTKAGKGRLTVKDADGKETMYAIPEDASVTIDGKGGKVEEIKLDSTVTVTSKGDDISKVEAKSPPAPPPPKTAAITGNVVGVDKDKLTVSIDDKKMVFTVPADAKVTIDGEEGKLADLKKDSTATVATLNDAVVSIDAKSPPPQPETKTSGKVLKVVGNKLTVLPATGEAKDFTVPEDATITLDGKDAKVNAIKADSTVTVTTKGDSVTKVEAKAAVPPPPPPPPSEKTTTGKVTKAEKGKLTVKDADGKETSFTIPDDINVEDIKLDATVTITVTDGKVTKVEAKPAAPPPPEALWDRLGGEKGVARVVDDFVNAAAADAKVNFFRDSTYVPSKEEVAALKTKLVEFVSNATGGPLKYKGKDMKEAHAGMKIKDSEFDACAADLKAALEKNGVKADDVKAVMAAVEGTRKDIVEVKGDDKPKPPDDKPKN